MLVKQVYFRRTARGGGRPASSRLLPITRWLQRMLVFMAVTDEADLKNKLEELLAPDPTEEPDEEHMPMEALLLLPRISTGRQRAVFGR